MGRYQGSTLVVFVICIVFMKSAIARPLMRLGVDISISIGAGDSSSNPGVFDVRSYGAKGDGQTDDSNAFIAAWEDACKVKSGVLRVPPNYKFLIKSTTFGGKCQPGITFQLDGLIAPPDMDSWPHSDSTAQWLVFDQLEGITIKGSGLVEGKGDKWWNLPCKPHRGGNQLMSDSADDADYEGEADGEASSGSCASPAIFKFVDSKNVRVLDIQVKNSPQVHLKFDSCDGVHVENITFNSPASSPNTDGIHIEDTKNVKIYNINIANGDDCISIGAGCQNVDIRNATCIHGHGISIGSLGVHRSLACVSNISVVGSFLSNSSNGVRIKTWQGGSGKVSGVKFTDLQMKNVRNPLIIDQYYCMNSKDCKNETSAVYVTDVTYKNIKGTYDTRRPPMHFSCSDSIPCTQIAIEDVELKPGQGEAVKPRCWKAHGGWLGSVTPVIDCLKSGSVSMIDDISNGC